MCPLVIRGSDGLESFLTSSVPDLKLDSAASAFEGANFEVDTDGGEEAKWLGGYLSLKMLSEKRRRRELLPTEELPIRSSLKR